MDSRLSQAVVMQQVPLGNKTNNLGLHKRNEQVLAIADDPAQHQTGRLLLLAREDKRWQRLC